MDKMQKAVEQIVARKGDDYLETVETMTLKEKQAICKEMDRLIAERRAGLI